MIAPHGLLHSHINLRGATLVTFGPLWIVAHTCQRNHSKTESFLTIESNISNATTSRHKKPTNTD